MKRLEHRREIERLLEQRRAKFEEERQVLTPPSHKHTHTAHALATATCSYHHVRTPPPYATTCSPPPPSLRPCAAEQAQVGEQRQQDAADATRGKIIEAERRRLLAAHAKNLDLKHLPKGVLQGKDDLHIFNKESIFAGHSGHSGGL